MSIEGTDRPTTPTGGLSRRRVVGTAATAAWAAPVIVTAAAAPAFAASIPQDAPPVIRTTINAVFRQGNIVRVFAQFDNTGGPTTSLRARVQATATGGGINAQDPRNISAGWDLENPATFAATLTMDAPFIKLDPQLGGVISGNSTTSLEFTFSVFTTNGVAAGNIAITPAATPNGTGNGATSVWR